MYAYIYGTLEEVDSQQVVIEANGIGYHIFVPGLILQKLPSKGSKVKLYTYMHLRRLSGTVWFPGKRGKNLFEKLITVSGVGPKAAMGMLSTLTVNQLALAILTGDRKTLCKAPGIGKKTADRSYWS